MRVFLLFLLVGCGDRYPLPDLTGTWEHGGIVAEPGVDGAEPVICTLYDDVLVFGEDGRFSGLARVDRSDDPVCSPDPNNLALPGGFVELEQAGTWVLVESVSDDRFRTLVLSEDHRVWRTEEEETELVPMELSTRLSFGEDASGRRFFMDGAAGLWWESE